MSPNYIKTIIQPPLTVSSPLSIQEGVWLTVTSLGYLSFTLQNDVCVEFDTRRLFSLSSAEKGNIVLAQHKCQFRTLKAANY